MTLIGRWTRFRRTAASAVSADIIQCAGVTVVTGSAVRFGRVRTHPGRGIARPRIVTLVSRDARARRAAASAVGADIIQRAGIAVVTRSAFRFRGVRAYAG